MNMIIQVAFTADINTTKEEYVDKPKCKDCGGEMNFYSSMMTFACLKCHNSIRGIVAWNEKEAMDKLKAIKEEQVSIKIKRIEITDDIKEGFSRTIFASIEYEKNRLFRKPVLESINVFGDWSYSFNEILLIKCIETGKNIWSVFDYDFYEAVKSEMFRKLYKKPLDNNKQNNYLFE